MSNGPQIAIVMLNDDVTPMEFVIGVLKTVFFMWWLRWCYFLGTSPSKLVRKYYDTAD